MSVRVPVNFETLVWARELSRLSAEELGKAAGVSAARMQAFEGGDEAPTYRQISLIAKRLDRPIAFFLAPVPVEIDVPQAADFRGRADDAYPPSLAREMKRAEVHRRAMLDLAGPPALNLSLRPIGWRSIEQRASELREAVGLNESFLPVESQQNGVLNFWRGLLEHHGFLVFQTTGVELEVFRGLSIHHEVLPIILLNGADSANAKVFTLFHEVAHLVNRTSGLCVLNQAVDEEAICNAFAANVLMPSRAVRALLRGVPDDERAEALARAFRVSRLAAAVRLRTLGVISDVELQAVREQSDADWRAVRESQRNGSGFVPQWRLKYRDLGTTYIGAVARAIEEDRVDYLDATYLLNARLPMVEQLFQEYYRAGGAE